MRRKERMKKQYYLIFDVETANSTEDALVYNIGYAVKDRQNRTYLERSLLVSDIFNDEQDLMKSAYYAKKIPEYYEEIVNGKTEVVSFYALRQIITAIMKQFPGIIICAYNAHFDINAMNVTLRWLTKSKYRYFFPYGTQVWDIWHMACQTICTQKGYRKFCEKWNFKTKSGYLATNAEIVYAYITKNPLFTEEHKGFDDVIIESEILNYCFRQHKKMNRQINRACWRIPQGV